MQWYENYCPPPINTLQGACLKGCSSLNTSLMLRESGSYLQENGSSVYVCRLDVRKAFYKVWHYGFFYKLAKMGCNVNLWKIMWNFYRGFSCFVQVAGGLSDWFEAKQGVHQGGPFSMKLYLVFNNDLPEMIRQSGFVAKVYGLDISCPAYADDISLAPYIDHTCSPCWTWSFSTVINGDMNLTQRSHISLCSVKAVVYLV